jgi:hypothetical protein
VSKFEDETARKWVDWVERVNGDIVRLHYRRVMWRGTVELIQWHPEPDDAYFLSFLTQLYVDGQAMAVRRQATVSDDAISMARLLAEMSDHPGVLSCEGFSRNGVHIDAEIVKTDRGELSDQARRVVGFANRTVAHLDRRGWDKGLTFGELSETITALGELHARYYLFLTGKAKVLTPTIQGDWRSPFRRVLTGLVDEDDERLDS